MTFFQFCFFYYHGPPDFKVLKIGSLVTSSYPTQVKVHLRFKCGLVDSDFWFRVRARDGRWRFVGVVSCSDRSSFSENRITATGQTWTMYNYVHITQLRTLRARGAYCLRTRTATDGVRQLRVIRCVIRLRRPKSRTTTCVPERCCTGPHELHDESYSDGRRLAYDANTNARTRPHRGDTPDASGQRSRTDRLRVLADRAKALFPGGTRAPPERIASARPGGVEKSRLRSAYDCREHDSCACTDVLDGRARPGPGKRVSLRGFAGRRTQRWASAANGFVIHGSEPTRALVGRHTGARGTAVQWPRANVLYTVSVTQFAANTSSSFRISQRFVSALRRHSPKTTRETAPSCQAQPDAQMYNSATACPRQRVRSMSSSSGDSHGVSGGVGFSCQTVGRTECGVRRRNNKYDLGARPLLSSRVGRPLTETYRPIPTVKTAKTFCTGFDETASIRNTRWHLVTCTPLSVHLNDGITAVLFCLFSLGLSGNNCCF